MLRKVPMFMYLDDEDWEISLPVRGAKMVDGKLFRADKERIYSMDIFKQIYADDVNDEK